MWRTHADFFLVQEQNLSKPLKKTKNTVETMLQVFFNKNVKSMIPVFFKFRNSLI
jgi:hypothetical protein